MFGLRTKKQLTHSSRHITSCLGEKHDTHPRSPNIISLMDPLRMTTPTKRCH
ncbi:hypothetical protein FQN60_004470 [Etheostoma spectabile]|uniref:Uncharacterized protein n=1 Tax=Etheostoma spectabile TaxID=54343 RepID=A0A5J5CYJ8_9PERO|nr:hypothetical protein FQN60_004470 [Etheostoma spectabile]